MQIKGAGSRDSCPGAVWASHQHNGGPHRASRDPPWCRAWGHRWACPALWSLAWDSQRLHGVCGKGLEDAEDLGVCSASCQSRTKGGHREPLCSLGPPGGPASQPIPAGPPTLALFILVVR